MLSAYLGVETFLKGVSNYLKKHAYSNAKTTDLWSALSDASGKDVNAFANNWITKIGFPVLTVAEEPGQISIKQSRFLSTGDVKSQDDETTWWVPLTLKTAANSSEHATAVLSAKEDTIRNIDDSFYKLNSNTTGFYRTNYPPPRLAKLGQQKDQLSIEDRIGLIGDSSALAVAGQGTSAAFLGLIEGFQSEENYLVWSQIISSLGNLRSVYDQDEQISAGLKKFALKLITPAVERVGLDFAKSEDYLTVQLRSLLVNAAGGAGHESVIAEVKKQFKEYMDGNKKAIHPNLRTAVFRVAVRDGGKEAYEAVKKEYTSTDFGDVKESCLISMGQVQSTELVEDYFAFYVNSGIVPSQDIHYGASVLALNGKTRQKQWELIQADWANIHKKLFGNFILLDRFVRLSLQKFASEEALQGIEQFFKEKDNKGYDRSLAVVKDTVSGNARYIKRDAEGLREWLGVHGYL
jgi:aminopeptidase N